ncbi:MAG: hypothetical protein JHD16_09280 [Solirubrobacteraceae bacterium]|nr:hypothetical protein [Solirubrobacteraceae bacterium]
MTGPPQVAFVERGTDLLPPKIAIVDVRRDLSSALRNGLRVTYTAGEPALLRADVLIVGDVVDRELLMSALPAAGPGDSLAKATIGRTPTGENVVRLAFNPAAKRTLRKFLKITVRLRLIASDAAGNQTVVHKRIALSLG